jgi:CHASE2 domain-containing sensor protein
MGSERHALKKLLIFACIALLLFFVGRAYERKAIDFLIALVPPVDLQRDYLIINLCPHVSDLAKLQSMDEASDKDIAQQRILEVVPLILKHNPKLIIIDVFLEFHYNKNYAKKLAAIFADNKEKFLLACRAEVIFDKYHSERIIPLDADLFSKDFSAELKDGTGLVGFSNVRADEDGVLREYSLRFSPSLQSVVSTIEPFGDSVALKAARKLGCVISEDQLLSSILLKPIKAAPVVSFDLLSHKSEEFFNNWQNKIIIFACLSPEGNDLHKTAFSDKFPGPFIFASVIETLREKSVQWHIIRRSIFLVDLLILIVVFFIQATINQKTLRVWLCGLILVTLVGTVLLLACFDVILPVSGVICVLLGTFVWNLIF